MAANATAACGGGDMNRQDILQKIRAVSAEGKGIVALYNEISAMAAREA